MTDQPNRGACRSRQAPGTPRRREAAATRPPVRGPAQGGRLGHLGAEHPDPRPGGRRILYRQCDDRRARHRTAVRRPARRRHAGRERGAEAVRRSRDHRRRRPLPPNDNGSTGPSVAKAAEDDGLTSGFTHYTDLDSTLQALMDGPVILGINWYSRSTPRPLTAPCRSPRMPTSAAATRSWRASSTPRPRWSGATTHGALLSGWPAAFRMSYATLEQLLAENGDCTAPDPLKAPAPPSPQPPSPQPPAPQPKPDWWDEFIQWFEEFFGK